ncbi:MAG: hypothetical protein ABI282_04780 [Candidatus Baltobacteraceae bacterium]
MFDVSDSLRSGLRDAQVRLGAAQGALAKSSVGNGGHSADEAMAQTAQAAIFDEALMNAVRARLSEIKSVTK